MSKHLTMGILALVAVAVSTCVRGAEVTDPKPRIMDLKPLTAHYKHHNDRRQRL